MPKSSSMHMDPLNGKLWNAHDSSHRIKPRAGALGVVFKVCSRVWHLNSDRIPPEAQMLTLRILIELQPRPCVLAA